MKVELGKEKEGYHAKVAGHKNLIAFGFSKMKIRELLTKLEHDD